ncbi:MAG: N-acetylmuramic acid 6-phosphate etherase, partial [Candidatus Neoclostridium sp.]
AGTSQKLVLNMISTALMIRSGYVYENLMINVRANNVKLKKRAANIVDSVTGCGEAVASEYLAKNAMNIKKTIEEIKSL